MGAGISTLWNELALWETDTVSGTAQTLQATKSPSFPLPTGNRSLRPPATRPTPTSSPTPTTQPARAIASDRWAWHLTARAAYLSAPMLLAKSTSSPRMRPQMVRRGVVAPPLLATVPRAVNPSLVRRGEDLSVLVPWCFLCLHIAYRYDVSTI